MVTRILKDERKESTMKKKNIINLIKYHCEHNEAGFRDEALEVASDFDASGDTEIAHYLMALLSSNNTFVPQMNENNIPFLRKASMSMDPLPLPSKIKDAIMGIVNAVEKSAGVNKFLFQGAPGTGKTESAKQLARILNRDLFVVDFDSVIDSKLGQTSKNISSLFDEINAFPQPETIAILFDEIDAIAMNRTDSNDLREMGRATSSILKGLDNLGSAVVLIATTNLYDSFDKALLRRFDFTVDFNAYTQEDLLDVADSIMNFYLAKFKSCGRNSRLFRKIIMTMSPIPYPGDLKNLIKTSIAFSKGNEEYDYLKRLYGTIHPDADLTDLDELKKQGFTVREIETLTGISRSSVSRNLKEQKDEK
jgi:SpoVK/Ycf46/Vps4 family AAA+-type ATPase